MENEALAEARAAAAGVLFDDEMLAEAVALFDSGDYAGSTAAAKQSDANSRDVMLDGRTVDDEVADALRPDDDLWKYTLEYLVRTCEESNDAEQAEAVLLRMLAWREGTEQFCFGNFEVSELLFQKSPEYKTVADATWFLGELKPEDGHAVPDVVGLLALGEDVAAKAAVAIWKLASRAKHRPKITESGGMELLAKAVSTHVNNIELQVAGCGALRLLCQGHALAATNRRTFVERLGGAEVLANSMRAHDCNPEVQREACGVLRAACTGYPEGARVILGHEGITLCLHAIASCPDEAVGEVAIGAICELQKASQVAASASSSGRDELTHPDWEVRLRTERERGLQFIIERLYDNLKHNGVRSVQKSLLGAAAVFLEDAAARQWAMDILEPTVRCMQKYSGYVRLQLPACTILQMMTEGHAHREIAVGRLAKAACTTCAKSGEVSCTHFGGACAVCQVMKDLPTNGDIQRIAIGVLRNICFGQAENKTRTFSCGAVPATIQAMQRFPTDANLQENALGALTSLCDTQGRAMACAREGGIESILAAMKRHANVGHMAELGCIILCMFCDDDKLRQQIVRAGAMSVAKTLSRKGDKEAQRWGCELLRDLSQVSQS